MSEPIFFSILRNSDSLWLCEGIIISVVSETASFVRYLYIIPKNSKENYSGDTN